MALSDDIVSDVNSIFGETFTVSEGWAIPGLADIGFDNEGKKIRLVSLFVDIRKSTTLVETLGLQSSARMYKAYVRGVTKIVNSREGKILSFNGDGIVAGFVGAKSSNAAVLSALNINWFNHHIMRPNVHVALDRVNAPQSLVYDWGIGIDVGDVLIVKGGMRGEENSDLVWAGNPVNYSVKVGANASYPYNVYVSTEVFDEVHFSLKGTDDQLLIWEAWNWKDKDKILWRTSWWFGPETITTVPDRPAPLPPPGPKRRSIFEMSARPEPELLLEALQSNDDFLSSLGLTPKPKPKLTLAELFENWPPKK